MSLNVKGFSTLGILEGSKVKEIIACIQMFLFIDINCVVILQEVPVKFLNKFEELLNCGAEKSFGVIKPCLDDTEPCQEPTAYTIAITNLKGDWEPIDGHGDGNRVGFKKFKRDSEKNTPDDEFTDKYKNREDKEEREWFYENKFIEIKNEKLNLRILGVHAPWTKGQKEPPKTSNTVFWKALEGYAEKMKNTNFIIIGDMNADTIEGSLYQSYLTGIRNSGYTLAVDELEEKEGRKIVTHGKNRIDHIIASPELNGKVTAQVIPLEILRLSDHAMIIADIKI